MKKKTITCALGTMMITAAAFLPVYAADKTADMNVNYTQGTTYTLSIPSTVTLSADKGYKQDNIGLSAINAAPDKKVQVKIKSGISNSEVELERKDDPSTKVVSIVTDKDDNLVTKDFVVAEFEGTSITPPKPIVTGTGILNFSKIEDAIDANADVKAGEYTGTIVFEGAVVDK